VAAHRAHPDTRWQDLPADMGEWAPTFLPFLDE
jgi:hypothetical protein